MGICPKPNSRVTGGHFDHLVGKGVFAPMPCGSKRIERALPVPNLCQHQRQIEDGQAEVNQGVRVHVPAPKNCQLLFTPQFPAPRWGSLVSFYHKNVKSAHRFKLPTSKSSPRRRCSFSPIP